MTSPSRVLAILGLFDETRPVWHTDELNETLGYTRATGYRYVKDLVEAGFLKKVSAGRHALGARIIELDYQLRRGDPVLFEERGDEAAAAGLGTTWDAFRRTFADLRKRGFYFSKGELEKGVGAAAVPLLGHDDDALAALTLVGRSSDLTAIGADALEAVLVGAANEIRGVLVAPAGRAGRARARPRRAP